MTQTRYMNTTAAVNTGRNSAPENILCAKLKNKYNMRIDAISIKSKTTSQLVKAAQGRTRTKAYFDPYAEPKNTVPKTAEPKVAPYRAMQNNRQQYTAARNTAYNPYAVQQAAPKTHATGSSNKSYTRIYNTAENLRERNSYIANTMPRQATYDYNKSRRQNPASDRRVYDRAGQAVINSQGRINNINKREINTRNAVRTYAPSEEVRKETSAVVRFLKIFDIDISKNGRTKTANAENAAVSVKNGIIGAVKQNIAGISLYAICIVMAIMVIYSFVSINNYSMDISDIESSIAELTSKESELTLQLEQKDDIRVIEQMATEQIGMVKSELVEKRFVSLAGDEKIEVLGVDKNVNDTENKLTFLSIFDRLFGGIGDYLK